MAKGDRFWRMEAKKDALKQAEASGADGGGRPVEVAANLIAELRAKFAAAEAHAENIQSETVERCACFVENGSFLHDQSPAKLFAVQCAKAMRVALAQKQTK